MSDSNPDAENQNDQPTSAELAGPSSPKNFKLSIPKTSSSNAKCLFCDKRDNLIRINKCVPPNTFVDQGSCIPAGARCCKRHIRNYNIVCVDHTKLKITSNESALSSGDIKDLLSSIRQEVHKKKCVLDFDDPTALNDNDYYNLTGITKEQFQDLAKYLVAVNN